MPISVVSLHCDESVGVLMLECWCWSVGVGVLVLGCWVFGSGVCWRCHKMAAGHHPTPTCQRRQLTIPAFLFMATFLRAAPAPLYVRYNFWARDSVVRASFYLRLATVVYGAQTHLDTVVYGAQTHLDTVVYGA